MMNTIPVKYPGKLALPFMLLHGMPPDSWTWLSHFLICYFHHKKDRDASRSKNQARTLDGILIGWSPTSNAIAVYNPQNQQYYEPDSSVYPAIVYNGGLFVSLRWDDVPAISKPYPPVLILKISTMSAGWSIPVL
jgi:hypothetical protein